MPNLRNRYPGRRRFLKQSAALTASASLAAPAAAVLAPSHAAPAAAATGPLELRLADARLVPAARRLASAIGAALSRPVRVVDERMARAPTAGTIVLRLAAAADAQAGGGRAVPEAGSAQVLALLRIDDRAYALSACGELPAEQGARIRAEALAAIGPARAAAG